MPHLGGKMVKMAVANNLTSIMKIKVLDLANHKGEQDNGGIQAELPQQ